MENTDLKKMKTLVVNLHKNDSMWFVLGSLISADNNMTIEENKNNREDLTKLLGAIESIMCDEAREIPDDVLGKYSDYIIKSIKLLENESKTL